MEAIVIDTERTLLDLDDDLLIHIAEYLPPHRILAIAQTCNRWSVLIANSELRKRALHVLKAHDEGMKKGNETRPDWLAFYAAQALVWTHHLMEIPERREGLSYYLDAHLDKELEGRAHLAAVSALEKVYNKLDDGEVQPYIDSVRLAHAPFKFLVGAPKPTVEIEDYHQTNKAAYFKVHLTTAGGTISQTSCCCNARP